MAFDDATRNRLQRFVGATRQLLSEEFTRQLQQVYAMDPASGEVADLETLGQLNDQQLETARVLREIMAHYLASEMAGDKAPARRAVLDRIVREQAFTVLNRLAALRMMEARGILLESVARGTQSQGFQLYQMVSGGALGDTGETYRGFLLSLFDRFAVELPALFDRFAPQSRLFPRETALEAVLQEVNDPDLEALWGEDETLGWIYQYFNSPEERRAMRKASQAPRNSRELAVRNQFFTPRYVVEFLVDNTLGRLWYNMTQGQTGLKEQCQYLLCTPDDVFLRALDEPDECEVALHRALMEGRFEALPDFASEGSGMDAMIQFAHCVYAYGRLGGMDGVADFMAAVGPTVRAQRFEELRTQDLWDLLFLECRADRMGGGYGEVYEEPWFVPAAQEIVRRLRESAEGSGPTLIAAQKIRDPRTIRLLDPACGSMHFGLYAFDLFLEIYREAWAWEERFGDRALDRDTGGAGLRPLQETYGDKESFLRDVPRLIIEHNIHGVEIDPRAAQIASLALWLRAQRAWFEIGLAADQRPSVGRGNVIAAVAPPAEVELRKALMAGMDELDAELFEKTLVMLKGLPELGVLLQVEQELPALIREVYGEHGDLFRESDEEQWRRAEGRLQQTLKVFAEEVQGTSYQGRLFALDALQGLQLIDLVKEQFDVVVMNPPFGDNSTGHKSHLAENYSISKTDLEFRVSRFAP